MTIEQLRRLKRLSEIQTHSPASLEELKEIVRMVTIDIIKYRSIFGTLSVCKMCEFYEHCADLDKQTYACMCNDYNGFELRMEDA